MKSSISLPKRIAADCARPSDTLAAEKNFSDVHAARKMIKMIRVCGRELCEAFIYAKKRAARLSFLLGVIFVRWTQKL